MTRDDLNAELERLAVRALEHHDATVVISELILTAANMGRVRGLDRNEMLSLTRAGCRLVASPLPPQSLEQLAEPRS
jgi:hypothetical protein